MKLRFDISDLPLRRRLFGGYRPDDVGAIAARWRGIVELLERDFTHSKQRTSELEEDIRTLRTRLESYIAREGEMNRTLADAHAQAQEIVARANAEARRIVLEAEERAVALRAEASARIAGAGDQIDDLLRARDALLASARAAVGEFDSLLARIDRGQVGAARLEAPAPERESAPQQAAPPRPTAPPPPQRAAKPARPAVPASDTDRVYEGRVEVEAGPFLDFAALSSFERALARIRGVADVYVRRFVDDRATIEVTLGEPTLLVSAMAADLPFGFDVQSMDDEGLAMTLHALPPLKVG